MRKIRMKFSGAIKLALWHCGFFHLLRILFPNSRVAVLRYHAVVDPADNYYTSPGISMSVREFERQVRYFAKRYKIISLDELVRTLQTGGTLPRNAVVFTFDDGYADNWRAAQILKTYEGTGAFYLTTDCISRREPLWLFEVNYLIQRSCKNHALILYNGDTVRLALATESDRQKAARTVVGIIKNGNRQVREDVRCQLREQLAQPGWEADADRVMLQWDQVRQMAAEGMTIGSHTLSHLNLPNADPEDALHEISQCREVLEQKLLRPVRHFSVPNSGPYAYYNESVKAMVRSCGYASSVISAHGFVGPDSDLLELRRIRTVPELHEVVATIELGKFRKS